MVSTLADCNHMVSIELTKQMKDFAWAVVSSRNFGQRELGGNGNLQQQYTGILGETVVNLLANGCLPSYNEFSITDLTINEHRVDVKSMGRNVAFRDGFVHNFVAYQKEHPNDIYIFTSVNRKASTVEICGWLTKPLFFERASFYDKGSTRRRADGTSFETFAPLYEIDNRLLHPICNRQDIAKVGMGLSFNGQDCALLKR